MELRDIEYFAVVAEHRSIGRAAEALGLSQPALSKSLRRLERSVEAKVVKRTPKGVELTSVGSALLAQVRRLRLTLNDISREAADLSQGRAGHLRIGTPGGFALDLVPTACATLLKEAPKVTMKITVGDRDASMMGLRNGELDLAITTIQAPRHEDLGEEYLFDEEFVVYVSANHRLAKRKQLTLADLVHERWATGFISGPPERGLSQAFEDAGLPPPNIAIETAFLPIRYHLVAASDLLSFNSTRMVRYAAARFRIRELHVKDLAYTRRVGVYYRKDAYLSPAARRFIEILKATAKEISRESLNRR
jgi:DNA-binding transcriptional LysR family regulator